MQKGRRFIVEFALEKELREPVVAWLKSRGYLVAVEFQIWHMADLVAGRYDVRIGRKAPRLLETAAVELKLHDVAGVLSQARENRSQVDWSYCAMPVGRVEKMKMVTLEMFRYQGVGLLSVGDEIREVVGPARGDGAKGRVESNLWRRCRAEYAGRR